MTAPAPVPDGTTPPAEAVEAVILTAIERRLRAVHYNPHPPAPDDRQCDCSACTDGIPAPDMAWHLAAAVVAALRLPERDRETAAKAWDRGYTAGHSNAMRRMSDEPNAPTSLNPYRGEETP